VGEQSSHTLCLLQDLHSLRDWVWLVIDDLPELRSAHALRQLELLVMRAPAELRFVLASRRDPQLGLHRLRLDGELTEIRAADLRFTLEESRDLLAEVLGRQPKQVRRLLVRTSVLERVNGELADLLTGGSGGGRVLRELEQANAFVVALDAQRSWFRYHIEAGPPAVAPWKYMESPRYVRDKKIF
jgi:LuxR family transcriptional regulator, maltose regulon positive regulatory protein